MQRILITGSNRGIGLELARQYVARGEQTDMGGAGAPLTPQESARSILRVVDGLGKKNSGGYFRWDGSTLPW